MRAHGISVESVCDACRQLCRKGVLAATLAAATAEGLFVALRVKRLAGRCVCRILDAGGALIDCLEQPPAACLATLAPGLDASGAQ
jgi:hypothetical protein